jgi:hypothetical protein
MALEKSKEKLIDLKSKKEEMKKELLETFNEAIKEAFEEFSELEAIKWKQYTPSWNDGEACEFSVDETKIKFIDDDEAGDNEDGFIAQYDLYEYSNQLRKNFPKEDSVSILKISIIKEIDILLNFISEDDKKDLFGNDVEITITRQGTKIEDYECDY